MLIGGKTFLIFLVTDSIDPTLGGLEISVQRVADIFRSMGHVVKVITLEDSGQRENANSLSTNHLAPLRNALLEPLTHLGARAGETETFRANILLLHNVIEREMKCEGALPAMVVSFFATTAGYIAQEVAADLRLRHIACVRGSDHSRDLHHPTGAISFQRLAREADWIVTTNEAQRDTFAQRFGRRTRVSVLHNSFIEGVKKPTWRRTESEFVTIFSDCGYAFKKGTHVLLRAAEQLMDESTDVRLVLAGRAEPKEFAYWASRRRVLAESRQNTMRLQDRVSPSAVERLTLTSDIYATASLGEGCSNASLQALCLGIPIVATRCGALPELAAGSTHVRWVNPADMIGFIDALREWVMGVRKGTVRVDPDAVRQVRARCTVSAERAEWAKLLQVVQSLSEDHSHDT